MSGRLWIEKWSIAETLYRYISQIFDRLYQRALVALRWFLLLTFLGVVISTIAECRPLPRAWQVVPNPGPRCRLAYGQLATMGAANVVTSLILVVLPIPIILGSQMTGKRYDDVLPLRPNSSRHSTERRPEKYL